MFPEKAAAHLQQMQTLRSVHCSLPSKPKQSFCKAPSRYTQQGGKPYNLQRHQYSYSRGGRSHWTSTVNQKPKWLEPLAYTSKGSVNHIILYLAERGFVEPQSAQLLLPVAMRLSHFHINWKVITTGKWVQDAVNGFQIPFTSQPDQRDWPNPPMYILCRAKLTNWGEPERTPH